MSKDFWIAIVLIALMGISGFAGWSLRGERVQTQIVKIKVKQDKAVEEVKKKKADREIVYIDRYKVIHDAQDNCLTQPLPPGVLQVLRASPTESRTDEGLRLPDIAGLLS